MPTRTTTFATGDVLTASDVNSLAGAWNGGWTPVVDQGATTGIANTANTALYLQFGKLVIAKLQVTLSAAGTAGSAVLVGLPVTPAGAAGLPIGLDGAVYDVSASLSYPCRIEIASTSGAGKLRFRRVDATTAAAGYWGVDPNVALASGDILYATVLYEAA